MVQSVEGVVFCHSLFGEVTSLFCSHHQLVTSKGQTLIVFMDTTGSPCVPACGFSLYFCLVCILWLNQLHFPSQWHLECCTRALGYQPEVWFVVRALSDLPGLLCSHCSSTQELEQEGWVCSSSTTRVLPLVVRVVLI